MRAINNNVLEADDMTMNASAPTRGGAARVVKLEAISTVFIPLLETNICGDLLILR